MTITELGALGEFVGAIGVVATLIYLAMQIRQNTRTARASAHLELARERREIYQHADTVFDAELTFRAGDEPSDRTTESELQILRDRVMAERSYVARIRNYETQWHFWRNGLIDNEQLDAYMAGLTTTMFGRPSVRELWPSVRATFHPKFQSYVEARLAGTS